MHQFLLSTFKGLGNKKNLLQKHAATKVDIDNSMLRRIEKGERNAKRLHVKVFSKIFNEHQEDLLALWLADKVYNVVKGEDIALKDYQQQKKN